MYNKRVRKPRKKAAEITESDVAFGGSKQHVDQPAHIVAALAHLHTNWVNNPNERKQMSRSNRRR